jgi:hypothetical protein
MGHVIAYEVLDDNTAFVIWGTDGGEPPKTFLARVNSSGGTVWTREVPGMPSSDAIRLGGAVVGVRFWRNDRGVEHGDSMIAFDHNGAQLWDLVLTPRQAQPDGLDAPPGSDQHLGGAVIADRFIEWTQVGSKSLMTGIDQRTGRRLFSNAIDVAPSVLYATATHLVWEDRDREDARVTHALGQSAPPTVQIHSVDATTGAMHHATAAGRGCLLDGNYITAVDNGSTQSLVAFASGDLGSRTDLAAQFDPLEGGPPFWLQSCGRYQDKLVFALETIDQRTPALMVVIADRTARPIRKLRLQFDTMRGLRGVLPGRFARQAPLSGELDRFVPVILPTASTGSGDDLVMLDLDAAKVSWTASLDSAVVSYLYRVRSSWYLTNVENRHLNVSLLDGELGELSAAIKAAAVAADAWVEQGPLPVHVGSRSVWLMSHDLTSVTTLPIVVLDASTLRPINASPRMRIKDVKSELSARTARGATERLRSSSARRPTL